MNDGKQTNIKFTLNDYSILGLIRVGKVEAEGRLKYGADNWQKVSRQDDIDHAIHHLLLDARQRRGLPLPDGEQDTDHLAHAVCRLMMAIGLEELEKG